MFRTIVFAFAIASLSACGGSQESSQETSTGIAPSSDAPAQKTPSEPAAAAIETEATPAPAAAEEVEAENPLLKRGRIVWLQCRSCHTLKSGEPHLTGPNLHGVIGRQAGAVDGFGFSSPVVESNVIWNEATLDAWLERPDQFIRGNIMAYAGLRRPADREAVIAYLIEETK